MNYLSNIFKKVIIFLIKFYQISISPLLGNACRFTPNCSDYMIAAVNKRGVLRGIWWGVYRILRCNPFNDGGDDPFL